MRHLRHLCVSRRDIFRPFAFAFVVLTFQVAIFSFAFVVVESQCELFGKKPDVGFRDFGSGPAHGAGGIFGRAREISGGIWGFQGDRSAKPHPRATRRAALEAPNGPSSAPAGPAICDIF